MNFFVRHWKKSIGAAFVVFVISLVSLMIINTVTQTSIFWDNRQTQLSLITERCRTEIQDWAYQKEQLLETLTGEINSGLFTSPEEYQNHVEFYDDLDVDVQAAFVGFEDKTYYVSVPFNDPTFDVTSREWYQAGLEADGTITFTEPYIDTLTDELTVTLAKKSSVNGKTCVVGMDISLASLNETLANLATSENGGAYLISAEGNVLTYKDESVIPRITEGEPMFVKAADLNSLVTVYEDIDTFLEQGITLRHIVDYDGVEKYVATTTIPENGWTLGVDIPLSDYDEEVQEAILAQAPLIILAICMSLLCVFVAVVLIAREQGLRKEQGALLVELNESNERLSIITNHDALTGVFNRRYLITFLEKRLQSYSLQRPVSLLMFDLDFFKSVNDKYGHSVGDEVLIATTKAAESFMRSGDVLARYGGEEFIIVLESVPLKDALEVAERIRKRVEENVINEHISVTISIGAIEVREGESIDELLERVDTCLYRAKNEGRNCVRFDK